MRTEALAKTGIEALNRQKVKGEKTRLTPAKEDKTTNPIKETTT